MEERAFKEKIEQMAKQTAESSAARDSVFLVRPGLFVRMFSSLSVEFNGRRINMQRGNTRVVELFVMLLLGGGKGLSKRELIDNLYGYDQEWCADPNKSVNNLLYRLKKQLASWGMDGASVRLEGGLCRLEAEFPVEVDVLEFQQKAEAALACRDAGRIQMLEEAAGLYTGGFLEEFCTDLWVIQKSRELEQLFFRVARDLGREYERSGDFPRARGVYHHAAELFPFESWQLAEIDCFIAMKDYNGAYELYQDTERLYDEKLGVVPGQEFLKRLDIIEQRTMQRKRSLSDITEPLREEDMDGAFYCSYQNFYNFCQILSRIAERSGQSLFLLLCTWNYRGGVKSPSEKTDLEEQQMALLKEVIGRVFRKGDIYTKYSCSQYLVVLSGTGRENGAKAFERLRRAWKQQAGSVGDLSYSMDSLLHFHEK